MFDYKSFAIEIKSRFIYGDTLRKLSPEIGVSVSTLSRVLRGSKSDIDTILKICKWLDEPITKFIKS